MPHVACPVFKMDPVSKPVSELGHFNGPRRVSQRRSVNSDIIMTPFIVYSWSCKESVVRWRRSTQLLNRAFQPQVQGNYSRPVRYFVLGPTVKVCHCESPRIFHRTRSLNALLVEAVNSWLASSYGACREPPNRLLNVAALCV